jgi:hypothetical protein
MKKRRIIMAVIEALTGPRRLAAALTGLHIAACGGGAFVDSSSEFREPNGESRSGLDSSVPVGAHLYTIVPLNLRSGPGTSHPVMAVVPKGARVVALAANPTARFYNVWHESRSGWCHGAYLQTALAPRSPVRPVRALIGLHGRADGPLQTPDLDVVRAARIEAVKLTSSAQPVNVDWLRQINPQMFIMVRMFADFRGRVVTSEEFARWQEGDLAPFYAKGIRDFEVHNEPNLSIEGWGQSWKDGREFAVWMLDVVRRLRTKFPDARFGYPGLSPGTTEGVRTDALKFLAESDTAVRAADWIGAHSYWIDDASMESTASGRSYEEILKRYPGKVLYLTEFSNVGHQGHRAKGDQYVRYYRSLRNNPRIGAAFSFVVSSSSGFPNEVWRLEDGHLTDIPAAVGARNF